MLMYVLLILGFVLLIKGADFFVDGSAGMAKIFKVPGIIVGLTIVAMGTSLPECAVSISAGLQGNNDIAISNVVGSNFFNLLVVCGVCSLIQPLPIDKGTLKKEFPFSIFSGIILLFLAADYLLHGEMAMNQVSRIDGLLLLVLFAFFLGNLLQSAWKNRDVNEEKEEDGIIPLWKCIVLIIVGIIAIKFGGDLVVDNASKIATVFGLSQNLIGLTIVAIGTSLPELVTSVVASKKKETDIAVGNVIGSNIFNILLILGISSLLNPIAVEINNVYDLIFLSVTNILVWMSVYKLEKIKRLQGCGMISLYVIYMIFVCIR